MREQSRVRITTLALCLPVGTAASTERAHELRAGTLHDQAAAPPSGVAPFGAPDDDQHLMDRLYRSPTLTRMEIAAATGADRAAEQVGAETGEPSGGPGGMSADEMARQSSNPLGGDFWILLNQFDNFKMTGDIPGTGSRQLHSWSFQPVMPFKLNFLGDHWIWVNRPTLPVVMDADVPDPGGLGAGFPPSGARPPGPPPGGVPSQSVDGIGDVVFFSLVGQSLPRKKWGGGDFVWGLGPTFQFPTATESELGSGKFSVGPSGVLAFIGKKFIVGGLYQQWIDVASTNSSKPGVNFSWLNVFYFLNFPGGWQVGGTPIITADWEADSDDRWTVPLGLGVYRTQLFGKKLPVKWGVEVQYMPIRPDSYGQTWNARFVVAPIIPALLGKGGIGKPRQ